MSDDRPLAADTSIAAERLQFEIRARMRPRDKFAVFLDLQATAQAIAEAGIRRRYPRADAQEVFLRRVGLMLDRETMIRCYGWDPELHR